MTKSDEMLIDFQKRNGGKLGVRRIKSKSIPQILLSLRIDGLFSTYAATRTSRRGVRCSVWLLLVHVVRFSKVASNLSRRPLQITPEPSSFQTKCNFQKEILLRFLGGMEALTYLYFLFRSMNRVRWFPSQPLCLN